MSNWPRPIAFTLALVAIAIVSYWPVYSADFVDFDDSDYVYASPHVRTGLTAENMRWAFTSSHSSNWHPLTWISHMLDVHMFGLDARGHHVVNVGLHTANVVLLFSLLLRLTGAMPESFFCAALFAIHPINVESVAWISQRKTILSTLFALLSIWNYATYVRRGSAWRYGASLVWFGLSLMSKQLFVTLPFALLLLDYWPLRRKELEPAAGERVEWRFLARGWFKLSWEKLPYLALALAAGLATVIAQDQAISSMEIFPLQQRIYNAIISYADYLKMLVWPSRLAVFYPIISGYMSPLRALASLVFLMWLTTSAFRMGERYRYLLVGWLWYLITMLPMIGLLHVGSQRLADRYAYVPFWGLFIAIVWGGSDLLKRLPQGIRSGFLVAAMGLLLVCSATTFQQARTWANTITLFENAVTDVEHNWLAHGVLAREYYRQGEYARAVYHSEKAIPYGKSLQGVYEYYGLSLYELGLKDKAIEALQQAVQLAPDRPLPSMNLGWVYAKLGEYDRAVEQYAAAERKLTPDSTPQMRRMLYATWGNTLKDRERWEEALNKFALALEAEPQCQHVVRDAGEAELHLGHVDRAVWHLQRAVELGPGDAKAHQLLAKAYALQGKHAESETLQERARWLESQEDEPRE
jgi:tetratricopeptide (TPR) repeat protein